MSQFSYLALIVIVIVIAVFFFLFKRKKATYNSTPTKQRRDEVWKSIKHFLKLKNEQGKEIIDSYVAKRKVIDFKTWKKENITLWNSMTSQQQKEKKEEFKIDPKEIYVVVFTTRDSKSKIEDKPRAIECEIIYARTINKNDKQTRNIVINGEMDYETESKWIDPLRKKDEMKLIKEEQRQAKKEMKRAEKIKKEMKKNKSNN